MTATCRVRAVRPIPWFPVVRPIGREDWSGAAAYSITDRRMFYIPAVLKHLDAVWVRRCVEPVLANWRARGELDVIDAQFGYPEGAGCLEIGRKWNLPVFITIRGVERIEIHEPRIGPQIIRALSQCAGVISVSHSLKDEMIRAGVPADQIRVIENAIDDAVFHTGDQESARRNVGLPLDAKVVLSISNLKEGKGVHVLLPAFARFVQKEPQSRLVIIGERAFGEHTYVSKLHRMAAQLKIADHVHFTGSVPPEQIGDWLRAADAFALATRREGRCNAILEALACGLPVVTTPVGDNAAMVNPPHHGRIVPVDDAQAMGQALIDVCSQTWDRQAISRSVTGRTWDDVARETLQFFTERMADFRY